MKVLGFNVIKNCFRKLCDPIKFIFNFLTILKEIGVFSDYNAKVTSDFEGGDSSGLNDYRPISALLCFF